MTNSPIPQCDPHAGYLAQKDEIDEAIARVLNGGRYILGPEVEAFEREFAAYIGVRHAVGVASGTDALELALRTCGVGIGDFVVTVSHTAVATIAAIERTGANAIVTDIDPLTFTMAPDSLETVLETYRDRVKAVIPVHLYGQPADMTAILDLVASKDIPVIEDCSQAHGARWQDRRVGTWGYIGAFSLYPTKNLGALGDAGILVTDDEETAERARVLRQYGWRQRYVSELVGVNSRLDEIQASLLRVKLRRLDADNVQRRRIAAAYDSGLRQIGVNTPMVRPGAGHVYHQYVIRCKERDRLMNWLRNRGIGTSVHYPLAIHQQAAYAGRLLCALNLHATTDAAAEVLSLPMFPSLDGESVARIIAALGEWQGR